MFSKFSQKPPQISLQTGKTCLISRQKFLTKPCPLSYFVFIILHVSSTEKKWRELLLR
jgi:hypothetical protein